MRLSQFHLATVKEVPADAEIASHQLMLRAGMIRKLASGLYTWSPLGLRVLRKVESVVREEMNRAGAIEMLMPTIQPRELWEETGRWQKFGPQLLKIKDRKEQEFCYAPTAEEVITDYARNELNSYKQLPVNFYQIQTKFRDEIRPRFGVMRAREFLMKDAYSFHLTQESLAATYAVMYQAYTRIFTRLGLSFRAVQADTGAITDAHALDHLDGVSNPGPGVVGVDQERGPRRKVLGEGAKRLRLRGKRFDVGVSHGSGRHQAEPVGGFDVAGRGEADHARQTGDGHPGLDPLRAAETEVDQRDPPRRGDPAPGRLGRQRGLERHLVEEV